MAKVPTKKQTTPKSTETDQIVVATVDLPYTMEQIETSKKAIDELTELSQELGLYDVDGNPLVKDESTMPVEASTEAVESVQQEINTTVAPEAKMATIEAQKATEASLGSLLDKVTDDNKHPELITDLPLPVGITISEPTNDAQTVKNGWGNPLPTKVVTIKKSYLRETVEEALYIANLGGALDTTFLPTMTCPFICRMLLPEDKYQEYLERKSQCGYDESLNGYNEVLVKGVDRATFWKNLIKVGNTGGFLLPSSQPTRAPQFTAKLLTRNPVADTIETKLKPVKAQYTREELEAFSIEDLRTIGDWYNLSFNSKQKYVKAIIEIQESKL